MNLPAAHASFLPTSATPLAAREPDLLIVAALNAVHANTLLIIVNLLDDHAHAAALSEIMVHTLVNNDALTLLTTRATHVDALQRVHPPGATAAAHATLRTAWLDALEPDHQCDAL